MYKKPYLEWVDRMMPLSRGFKTLDYSTFSGEDGKSTIEHIDKFTAQCGEANQNEFYKLQLFPLSLTGATFTWYFALAPNSTQN